MSEHEWTLSRKSFIKTLVLSGIALQLPWLNSCAVDDIVEHPEPLSIHQYKTIRAIQDILFPDDGNGPSARDINATPYLVWVLNDAHLDPDEATFLIERLDRFIKECKEKTHEAFIDLSVGDQEDFVANISKEAWGINFLSRLLTLIFEALLLDPTYGSNPNNVGWDWLNHNPGFPRPNDKITYPEILARS